MPSEKRIPVLPVAQNDLAVGMAGTFDVENYGDLLFPLIAAAELERRNSRIQVVPFSVNGRSLPAWPFHVRPMHEMAALLPALSAMLIGGGQIVRFDRGYPIPVPADVDLPFAFWLTPAVLAALNGKPVIWNAAGATKNWPHAPWHDQLLRQVFAASYFIGVRDAVSRDRLAKVAPGADIQLLPDTAFGLSQLWPFAEGSAESVEYKNWRMSLGLEGKYVVVQANTAVGHYRSRIESLVKSMANVSAVVLPVCWCHGDRAEEFPEMKSRVFLSRAWLGPRLITEIIGRSEFVFASSLHACIAALSYGVPAARVPVSMDRKYDLLDEFEGIAQIDNQKGLHSLVNRGRWTEPRAIEYADRLERYWDHVANIVLDPPLEHCNFSRTLMLSSVAKACGDRKRLGTARILVVFLRESLAGYFPSRHFVLNRCLSFLKGKIVAAFWWTTRMKTPHVAAPKSAAQRPPIPAGEIAAEKF